MKRLPLLALLAFAPVAIAGAPLTRDATKVTVEGREETWSLEFTKPPTPVCFGDDAPTAPCMGFSHGESGEAALVRRADGKELQRLPLLPLYREGLDHNRATGEVRLPSRAKSALVLEDLDGDGLALELILQTDSIDSSMQPAIALAWDARAHKLDAVRTVEHPERPLVLTRPSLWRTLRKGGAVALNCGNHGGDVEEALELKHDKAGWHATAVMTSCDEAKRQTREVL